MEKITDLTKKQQKAFLSLRKAFIDCNRAGLTFTNHLNKIIVYDSKYVSGSTDDRFDGDINEDQVIDDMNVIDANIDQWVDCTVYLKLTEKGKEVFGNQQHNILD